MVALKWTISYDTETSSAPANEIIRNKTKKQTKLSTVGEENYCNGSINKKSRWV